MKEITRTWETVTGKKVEVIGRLITEKINYSDGWNVTVPCCDIQIDVKAEGKSQGSWVKELTQEYLHKLAAHGLTGYSHIVGKLPLTPEQVGTIESVKAELEATPEWQAKQAKIKKNQRDIEAIENSHGFGWCDKCHSYCFGDCEAN